MKRREPKLFWGVWDGDGSWSKSARNGALIGSFGGASQLFVSDMHDFLQHITMGKGQVRGSDGFWTFSYQGIAAVRLASWMYCDTEIRMHRKYVNSLKA